MCFALVVVSAIIISTSLIRPMATTSSASSPSSTRHPRASTIAALLSSTTHSHACDWSNLLAVVDVVLDNTHRHNVNREVEQRDKNDVVEEFCSIRAASSMPSGSIVARLARQCIVREPSSAGSLCPGLAECTAEESLLLAMVLGRDSAAHPHHPFLASLGHAPDRTFLHIPLRCHFLS